MSTRKAKRLSRRSRNRRNKATRQQSRLQTRLPSGLAVATRAAVALGKFFFGTGRRAVLAGVGIFATFLGLYATAARSTASIAPIDFAVSGEIQNGGTITAVGPFALHNLRSVCSMTAAAVPGAPPDARSGCDKFLLTPDWDTAAQRNKMISLKNHGTVGPDEAQVKHTNCGSSTGSGGPNTGFALAAEFETRLIPFLPWHRRVCHEYEVMRDSDGKSHFVPRGPNEFPPWAK